MSQNSVPFWIDLDLHHPSCDPGEVTRAFGLEPRFAHRKGDRLGNITHKSNSWFCRFKEGLGNTELNEALETVLSFVSEHEEFLEQFTKGEGTIELILNSTVKVDEGLIFELCFHPWFLNQLSTRSVSLRIQAWSD